MSKSPDIAFARKAGILVVNNLLLAGLGFLSFTLVAHRMPAATLGIFAAVIGLCGLAATAARLGLDATLVLYLRNHSNPRLLLLLSLGVTSAVAIVIGIVLSRVLLFGVTDLRLIGEAGVLAALTSTNTILDTILQIVGRTRILLVRTVIGGTIRCVAPFVPAYFGDSLGVEFVLGAYLVASLVAAAIGLLLAVGKLGRGKVDTPGAGPTLGTLTLASGANHIASLALAVPALVIPSLLVRYAAPNDAAYFYVASTLAGLAAMVPQSIVQTLFVEEAETPDPGRHRTRERQTVWISVLSVVGVAAVSPLVLAVIGNQYARQALVTTLLLLASVPLLAVQNITIMHLRLGRRYPLLVIGSSFTALIVVGATVYGAHLGGLAGPGVGWLAGYAVAIGLLVIFARRWVTGPPEAQDVS